MIKVKSRAELGLVPRINPPAAEPKPAISDVVEAAMASLANQVQTTNRMVQAMAESQQEAGRQLIEIAAARKPPIRLEAEILRDPISNRMTNIIITPIHD